MTRLQLTLARLPRESKTCLFSTVLATVMTLCASNLQAATIYKSVDKNGNIVFTDQPLEGAEEIKKTTSRSSEESANESTEEQENEAKKTQPQDDGVDFSTDMVANAPDPTDPPPIPEEEEISYLPVTRVEIISPPHDAVLIDPLGKIWVEMNSAPTSIAASGLTAQLWLNNKLVKSGNGAILALPIPSRGTHELQVKLVDHKDQLHAISDMINFHVKFQLVESNR